MSGHSKWETIKRKKGVTDQARGKLFSKFSKAISMAVKTGGGSNIDMNYKLRIVVDIAKTSNMPKDTIDRAIKKASDVGNLSEITYEGFGPGGVQMMIETATDNKNRTAQEMKTLLSKADGNMGGPGSVAFNFKPYGFLLIEPKDDIDTQILEIIDLGVEDIEQSNEGLEAYVKPSELFNIKQKLESANFKVSSAELIKKPLNVVKIENESNNKKLIALLTALDDHDDVQNVFTNAE